MLLKEPTIINNEDLLTVVTTGSLSKGGILNNTPDMLTLSFSCTSFKQSKSDLEVNFSFHNGESINLYFVKECDTIGDVQEYFTFFYTIYYILMLIFFGFVITIIYYYFRRNDLSLMDVYTY